MTVWIRSSGGEERIRKNAGKVYQDLQENEK